MLFHKLDKYRDIGLLILRIGIGVLMFNLFATFAEFERELISERTKVWQTPELTAEKVVESQGFQEVARLKPGLH